MTVTKLKAQKIGDRLCFKKSKKPAYRRATAMNIIVPNAASKSKKRMINVLIVGLILRIKQRRDRYVRRYVSHEQ